MKMKTKQHLFRQKQKVKLPVDGVEWIKQPERPELLNAVFQTLVVALEHDNLSKKLKA
jgi:RNA polymerase-interacting CarD/CdnL/TRCF family regulator